MNREPGPVPDLTKARLIQLDPCVAMFVHPFRCIVGAYVESDQTFGPAVRPYSFDDVTRAGFHRFDVESGDNSLHRKPGSGWASPTSPASGLALGLSGRAAEFSLKLRSFMGS
jgi:hypothetical protein